MWQETWKKGVLALLTGWLLGMVLGAIFLAIAAVILSAFRTLPVSLLSPVTLVCAALGALFAGFWMGRWMKCRGLLWGLVCGMLLLLSEVLIGVCLMTPSFESGQAITKAVAMLISGALGGLWGANREEKIK